MVRIMEVKDWTFLKACFIVRLKTLGELKELADAYGEPYVFKKKKEYVFFRGITTGGAPICFQVK